MQLRIPFAAAIYLGSYLPLSVILLAQDVDEKSLDNPACGFSQLANIGCSISLKNPAWSLGAVAICTIGLALTIFSLRLLPARVPISIIESKHIPADLINYVIPYVVSFMSLDYQQVPKLFGFLIFLGWIFLITYKSGQIALNPVLSVLGWKLYEIKYKYPSGTEIHVGRLLSKSTVNPGKRYYQNSIQDVMVAKRSTEGDGW
ncbi:hypothetical protein [Methylobacterium indicum]|uniref:hypothetical protein n=1 Tax=Methylobacterium indicum TaxID=1775910 RepID=UPI000A62C2C3|nr:hypothetical protein [Methylobacterium indicum]